jgi:hypothetical protein
MIGVHSQPNFLREDEMATNKITAANKDEVANKLQQIRDHMQTPDSFGRMLLNDLLSNAVSKGTLTPDGAIEVSVKAKIQQTSQECYKICLTGFGGIEIGCIAVCHST